MQGLQAAVNGLTALLGTPSGSWETKAEIICEFVEAVSRAVLVRCGLDPEDRYNWIAEPLAHGGKFGGRDLAHEWDGGDRPGLADLTHEICLINVPATLSLTPDDSPPVVHYLLFGEGRVVDWDTKYMRPHRIMTYEEAVRLIVFWLAEKILKFTRKNNWDRVRQLPDLYDRLTAVTAGLTHE